MDISIDPGPDSTTSSGGCAGGTCTCGERAVATPVLDVRAIPAVVRHAAVHGALAAIPVSGSIVLAAPHEPLRLLAELEEQQPGAFSVSWDETGPDTWLVRLTRQH